MSERGFLLAGAALYAAIGAGVVIVGLSVAVKIQSSRLASCQEDFASHVAQVKVAGEAQIRENERREESDLKLKERTDADHKTAIARLNRDLKRLRDDNARRSLVPKPSASSTGSTRACFEYRELDNSLRAFVGGITDLVGEGETARIGLNEAKLWNQQREQN